jgi:hypothetical protein
VTALAAELLERCLRLADAMQAVQEEWEEVYDLVAELDEYGVLYPDMSASTPGELRDFAAVCHGDAQVWRWFTLRVRSELTLAKVRKDTLEFGEPGDWEHLQAVEQRFAEHAPRLSKRLDGLSHSEPDSRLPRLVREAVTAMTAPRP